MQRLVILQLSMLGVILLSSCGGGGSSGASGFQQTYISSAAQGELISYEIDTSSMTYSFRVIRSEYGCEVTTDPCHQGSGSLTKNSDGSYSLSGATSSRIFFLQNGMLVGSVKVGTMPDTPIIGIPSPVSDAQLMAGTYNFISVQCPTRTAGQMTGCGSTYGSIKVTPSGGNAFSYETCEADDVDAPGRTCQSVTTGTGSFNASLSSWVLKRDGSNNENFMAAFEASNGQRVAFIDFNDPGLGGYGYGQATVSEKIALSQQDADAGAGRWFLTSLAPGANSDHQIVTASNDGTVSTGGQVVPNTPWAGFLTNPTSDPRGRFIMAGSGLFTYGGYTDLAGNAKYILGQKMD